jgi:predicted AAA+ superfamily ATPase
MYIKRSIEDKIIRLLDHFPAVAILGPRQAGKTTLVKEIRKKLPGDSLYLDLENPADSAALDHPVEFLNSVAHKAVIIDEIQRRPDLFPVLRSVIDSNRKAGRFILLGSAGPQLLFLSNETLAGRIVYLELTPFQYAEISTLADFRDHWVKGGFPVPFLETDPFLRKEWFKSFLSAYAERDLRLLGLNTSTSNVQRLIQMVAASQGSLLNSSNFANSLGITAPTVGNIISFLDRSYMTRLLQPWHANIGKRLVRSPKLFMRDTGIANFLLNISTYEDLLRHPHLGHLWEGYVIENIINALGDEFRYYFYRTADGTECDLLVFRGETCIAAIDAKFSPSPNRTRSMTIALGDIKPAAAFFAVPECQVPYDAGDNLVVGTPWQVCTLIREGIAGG